MNNSGTNNTIGKLPEGEFCGDYCYKCRYYRYDHSYHKYWCEFHERWVDGGEWHECCE